MLKDTFTSLPSCRQRPMGGHCSCSIRGYCSCSRRVRHQNNFKKNRLVWKHCVQIKTLTSLCKNSTRNLYEIFYRPSFKFCIKSSPFFGQVALFSQTITHVMFCSLFSICSCYYDKNGKIMWRLS